jgi:hypothetical protein
VDVGQFCLKRAILTKSEEKSQERSLKETSDLWRKISMFRFVREERFVKEVKN